MTGQLGHTGLPTPTPEEEPRKPRRIYRQPLTLPGITDFQPGRGRISPMQAAFLSRTAGNGMSMGALVTLRNSFTDRKDRGSFDRAVRRLRDRKFIEVRDLAHRKRPGVRQRRIMATPAGRAALKEFFDYANPPKVSVD